MKMKCFEIVSKDLLDRLLIAKSLFKNSKMVYTIQFEVGEDLKLSVVGPEAQYADKINDPNIYRKLIDNSTEFSISINIITNILKVLPNTSITFSINDNSIIISYTNGNYTIPIESVPHISVAPTSDVRLCAYSIDSRAFADMLRTTKYAVSNDELRVALSGLYLNAKNNQFYGADTFRIVRYSGIEINGEVSMLIPAYLLPILQLITDKSRVDEKICLSSYGEQGVFEYCGKMIVFRLINAKFPNCDKFFEGYNDSIEIDRRTLINTLRRVLSLTSNKDSIVQIIINNDELTIDYYNDEQTACETMAINSINFHIYNDYAFHIIASQLLDIINTMSSDSIILQYKSKDSPIVIKSECYNSQVDAVLTLCKV